MIQIQLAQPEFAVGATLQGVVQWIPADRRGALRLTVRWRTEGRGDTNKETVARQRVLLDTIPVYQQGSWSFSAVLPPHGPPSYDGSLLRIIWEVQARLEGGLFSSEQQTLSFRVLPRVAVVASP